MFYFLFLIRLQNFYQSDKLLSVPHAFYSRQPEVRL